MPEPIIIPQGKHSISRQKINRNALKVLSGLHEAGYSAYLVGGCVRDLLLGRKPKDFDVATNALPEDIQRLFKNCRLIGKRFRLAHLLFGKEIIEVATFRSHHENATHEHHRKSQHGMIMRDNVYGPIEDDVWRRDFKMNALYCNVEDFSIVDYVGGFADIRSRTLSMIGEPEQRYHEDPVRLLRAVRFMAKLQVRIHPETEAPIQRLSYLLQHVSSARLFQEVLKIFQEGHIFATIQLLQKYDLFVQLFPTANAHLSDSQARGLLKAAFKNTDLRIQQNKPVSTAFLFAVLLWHPFLKHLEQIEAEITSPFLAYEKAIQVTIKEQVERLAIPRSTQIAIREIYILQYRFSQRRSNQAPRLVDHPRFRAAYDLLLLRAQVGEAVKDVSTWWSTYYTAHPDIRTKMLKEAKGTVPGKKRRRKRSKKPFKSAGENEKVTPTES